MKSKFSLYNKKEYLEFIFEKHLKNYSETQEVDVEFLVKIVNLFRPHDINVVYTIDLTPLLNLLEENNDYKKFFSGYLNELLKEKDFDQIISDAGIIKDTDFLYEIRKRLSEKILPFQPSKDSLQFILNQVFYRNTDPQWIERIPEEQIDILIQKLELKSIYTEESKNFELLELLYGIEVLIQRISGRAMESDVNKMVPEFQNFDSPFIAIQREFAELNDKLIRSNKKFITSDDLSYKQVLILHKQCQNYINTAFTNSHKYGISLKVNQSLLRIRQQLDRVKELLPYLVVNSNEDKLQKTRDLSLTLIKYNCNKNNIRQLVNESTQLLSYEVTQHTARTGEHYITNSRKEYFRMFRTACGGGLIVAFLCVFKVLLSKVEASDLGYAFLYSMNYALGFIAIYLLGFTLATKQPAMTASALISALEQGAKTKTESIRSKYKSFAVFFARVFRSQFIAFLGNVVMVFPVALLLIWLIDLLFNYNIAHEKWQVLLTDLSPVHSPAIFHSAIAGFFLFISGVIAGSIANRDKHNSVYYRIQEHPVLKKTLGKERTSKIAKIYEKKWAGIISNLWFGVFMGTTASIGLFIGLNLDIRHITFAGGNLALGLYGGDFDIPISMIIWGIFGIGIIGLINFLVSFTLSLSLAFRSRSIPLLELRLVALSIWRFFRERPSAFFFPPKR